MRNLLFYIVKLRNLLKL